jgi:hypothetical protein
LPSAFKDVPIGPGMKGVKIENGRPVTSIAARTISKPVWKE